MEVEDRRMVSGGVGDLKESRSKKAIFGEERLTFRTAQQRTRSFAL